MQGGGGGKVVKSKWTNVPIYKEESGRAGFLSSSNSPFSSSPLLTSCTQIEQ